MLRQTDPPPLLCLPVHSSIVPFSFCTCGKFNFLGSTGNGSSAVRGKTRVPLTHIQLSSTQQHTTSVEVFPISSCHPPSPPSSKPWDGNRMPGNAFGSILCRVHSDSIMHHDALNGEEPIEPEPFQLDTHAGSVVLLEMNSNRIGMRLLFCCWHVCCCIFGRMCSCFLAQHGIELIRLFGPFSSTSSFRTITV